MFSNMVHIVHPAGGTTHNTDYYHALYRVLSATIALVYLNNTSYKSISI